MAPRSKRSSSLVDSSIIPKSEVKIKTEEDMICNFDKNDEPMVVDADMDESLIENKPFSQSQSQSFTRSQLRPNFDTSFISQRSLFLEDRMQKMFDAVKELWYRQQKVSAEDLQLFTMCNQDQISEVCKHLELGEVSEGILVMACEQFISLAQQNFREYALACVQIFRK